MQIPRLSPALLRRVGAAATIAVMALLTAAYAATGAFTLGAGQGAGEPGARLSAPSGFQVTSVSSVTWSAANIVPGDVSVSQISVTNSGATAGAFALVASGLTDVPSAPAQTLSSALRLSVQDITVPSAPVTVYNGSLASIAERPLGLWQPGETRSYRFTTTFPLGRLDALDNALQDAATTIQYAWIGVIDGLAARS